MTITYFRNSGEFLLSHHGNSRTVFERDIIRLARTNEWGDVESLINAAKQNPGIAITVGNTSRVPAPRNSRVYAVAQ